MEPNPTILIADNAALFRELGRIFLERTGHVVTANDGHEGLQVLREQCPSVVVAELDMPRMGGDELCRRIKTDPETRGLPVILLTGTDLADDRARAMRAGADDVIPKPISRIGLVQAVNRFLRHEPQRSLARVPFESEVRILQPGEVHRGTARNLSRGGIFVETEPIVPTPTELSLEFTLPDLEPPITTTAQVAWRRPPGPRGAAGMGLQFLALDGSSANRIDAFVYENAVYADPPVAANTGEAQ